MGKENRNMEKKEALNFLSGEIVKVDDPMGEVEEHPVAGVLEKFLCAIDDYRGALISAYPTLARQRLGDLRKIKRRVEKSIEKVGEGEFLTTKNAHDAKEIFESMREMDRLLKSKILDVVKRSFFIGLFSEYDSFIGELLAVVYSEKPELYKTIRREVALSELLCFDDLNDVKRDMLEKEIDSFRRQSYVEQFYELERRFEIKTLSRFDRWADFVEIGQRRNVVTHNDGRVSNQYLSVCEKNGVVFEKKPEVGDVLEISREYLLSSMLLLSSVGFMLTHTLWRKLFPKDVGVANEAMNNSLYNLLLQKRWKAAAVFGEFSLTDPMVKGISDVAGKIRLINCAIALKHSGDSEKCQKLLESVDWSASVREFKLAGYVLSGDYASAAKVMKKIGKQGEFVDEVMYHTWPLFEDFRGTVDFLEAYESIYGIPFLQKVSERGQDLMGKTCESEIKGHDGSENNSVKN